MAALRSLGLLTMGRSSPTRLLPVLQCVGAAALFGAATPFSKALLSSLDPLTLAGLLYLGAAISAFPFALKERSGALWHDRRQQLLLLGAVVFGGGLAPVLLLTGLKAAHAASVSLWLNLEVVATTLLAAAFFREHLDRRTALAVVFVFLGGVLLAANEGAAGIRAGLLVAFACVCWGFDNNFTASVSGFTPPQTTFVKGLVAGAVNLGLGLSFGERAISFAPAGAALLVGGVCYGASIILYISGAQQLGASRSQMLFATSGFFGVFLAWTFLGEHMLPMQGIAGGVMLLGLVLMLTERHEHDHAHEAMSHTHSHRHDDGHHTHIHPGLPAWVRHTHPHTHETIVHSHPHVPDLHHRHEHKRKAMHPVRGRTSGPPARARPGSPPSG